MLKGLVFDMLHNLWQRILPRYNQNAFLADRVQSEEFRTLRTNIEFAQINKQIQSLLITSSIHEEGKTTIATNLGHVMAQTKNKRVLIVDADLRRPAVHKRIKISNDKGLTSLILDEDLKVNSVIQQCCQLKLSVLTCGPIPPNPSELLSSDRMTQIMQTLNQQYDFIIYDTPPVNLVTDGKILAMKTDAVLLVVRENYTEKKDLINAKKELDAVQANILGHVLNDTNQRKKHYYYQSINS